MRPSSQRAERPAGVLVAAFFAAIASACAAPPAPAPPSIPPDFEAAIGGGGGFAGAWRTVRLRADGTLVVLFTEMGRVTAEVPAGILDPARRSEAWTLLGDAKLGALGCVPGNMTEDIEFRADGVTARACAPMGQGSPEFRRIHDALARLIEAPAAGVQPPPPPLPPLPWQLCLEVVSEAGRFRVVRPGARLPPEFEEGARALPDADMLPLWEALFSAQFYSGASIEQRDGVPLPGAPYSCGTDLCVRVTSGTGQTDETRSRCVEGDAAIAALADAITRAAAPARPTR